jgi:aminoglycoside phosphotransferase (APT) family kinase protein
LTEALERIAQRVEPDARLVRSRRLAGGVSARLTVLDMRLPQGETRTIVVRRHGEADRERDPQVAAHEFRLLQLLKRQGLPVPAPYLLDESGEILPEPYLVIEYLAGESGAHRAAPGPLAEALAKIHAVNATAAPFLPELESVSGRNERVLLHGDYWPGNTLWQDDELVGIVDWEDAALGDPLADVANCRLELVWASGADAAAAFTEHYADAAPRVDLADVPRWDLYAARRLGLRVHDWGLDESRARELQSQADEFAATARQRLSSR